MISATPTWHMKTFHLDGVRCAIVKTWSTVCGQESMPIHGKPNIMGVYGYIYNIIYIYVLYIYICIIYIYICNISVPIRG